MLSFCLVPSQQNHTPTPPNCPFRLSTNFLLSPYSVFLEPISLRQHWTILFFLLNFLNLLITKKFSISPYTKMWPIEFDFLFRSICFICFFVPTLSQTLSSYLKQKLASVSYTHLKLLRNNIIYNNIII